MKACPGRDAAPGDPCILRNGACIYCLDHPEETRPVVNEDVASTWQENPSTINPPCETCHETHHGTAPLCTPDPERWCSWECVPEEETR